MKNNEQLLNAIGEINEKYVSEKNIKKKPSHIRSAAIGSAVCAAAVAGFFVMRGTGLTDTAVKDKWADCRIFPLTSEYSGEVIAEKEPIYCGLKRHIMHSSVQERDYVQADKIISVIDFNNPWNKDMELTALPVFENLSYSGDIAAAARYLTDETMLTMAENAAKQLGAEISESGFSEVGDTSQNAQRRYALKAVCSGEKYGVNLLSINVYSDGAVEINFNDYELNGTGSFYELPEGCSLGSGTGDMESHFTLDILAETFSDLLQFNDPRYVSFADTQTASQDNGEIYSQKVYRIYEHTDSDVRNILNYNLAFADFSGWGNRLYKITLMNRLSVSEYLGYYPLISLDEAREMLLKGAYVTNVTEDEMRNEKLGYADIESAELVYRFDNNNFYLPYYRFYVKLNEPPYLAGTGLNLYGAFYVPAIEFENVNFGFVLPDLSDEIIPAYPRDTVSLPDNTEISKTEAFSAFGTADAPELEFDFGFLRYGEPIFQNTLEDPYCFDFDTMTFTADDEDVGEPVYFKVKAGDVLDNGLTVTKARYKVVWDSENNCQKYVYNIVEFCDGTGYTSYDGIIRYFREDGDYVLKGDMYFYPDPSGAVRVPVLYTNQADGGEPKVYIEGSAALRTDGGSIYVGNASDRTDGFSASAFFGDSDFVRARLDLKYIVFADYAEENDDSKAVFIGWELLERQNQ